MGKGLGTDGADASKSVVYGWEKDQHFPRVDQLVLICERLDCSSDYLLFGKVAPSEWSKESAEIAAELDSMLPRQRAWTLSNIRTILEVSNETFRLAQKDEPSDGNQEPVRKRAAGL